MRSRVGSLLLFCLIAAPDSVPQLRLTPSSLAPGKMFLTRSPATRPALSPGKSSYAFVLFSSMARLRNGPAESPMPSQTAASLSAGLSVSMIHFLETRRNIGYGSVAPGSWSTGEGQYHSTASAGLRPGCFECDLVPGLCCLLWINRKRQAVICCGRADCRSQAGPGKKNIAMVPRGEPIARVRGCTVAGEPLRVTFQPSGATQSVTTWLGSSAVLVEDGDGNEDVLSQRAIRAFSSSPLPAPPKAGRSSLTPEVKMRYGAEMF